MFAGIAPARHPADPEKPNRALGCPALVTGLYQFYRVPVPPWQGHVIIGKYAYGSTDFSYHLLFAGIVPGRHLVDPKKANSVLELPALITGLCQFYRVPVTSSKGIRPPTNRAFIKKYCAPDRRRAKHHSSIGMVGSGKQTHRDHL